MTLEVGKHGVAEYAGNLCPGLMTQIPMHNSAQVNCLQKATTPTGFTWKWPEKKDKLLIPFVI